MQKIELLAPARNRECAHEAILHGADAVYMGGPGFGARAAAGNSVEDIAAVCTEAHAYGVRIYVTLNTILSDEELLQAKTLVWQLYEAGVDALIVQDMGLLELDLPPIALHASTQMDNRTPEKVKFLAAEGLEQVVLARELSLNEIAAIHAATPVALEAFVHGALCVSFSGQCYASQYCFSRSANRGECAQFCRMAFDLVDAEGQVLIKNKHLLSLRDMNRSRSLEEMMDAGISSFKIEGRLKDVGYVKNVTAFYRKRLDEILQRRSQDYCRASYGESQLTFEPRLEKSFNRGFTDYYLHERKADVASPDTPKAIGERVGEVKQVGRGWLTVSGGTVFSNGDGLCFKNDEGQFQGFRVNRAEGNKLFPAEMPDVAVGTHLYRNADQAFEKVLSHPSAVRKMKLNLTLQNADGGYTLQLADEAGRKLDYFFPQEYQSARTPQHDNIVRQLSRLGNTPYEAAEINVKVADNPFIPSSVLAEARREGIEQLLTQNIMPVAKPRTKPQPIPYLSTHLTYLGNVANNSARRFYAARGVTDIAPAFEQQQPERPVLMFCRYCLRYQLGHCPRHQGGTLPWREPLELRLGDGRCFPLEFDCKNCQMKVYAPH